VTPLRAVIAARICGRWWARRADRTGTTPPDRIRDPGRAACWDRQLVDDVGLVLDELAAVLATDELIDQIGAGVVPASADPLTRMLVAWRASSRPEPDRGEPCPPPSPPSTSPPSSLRVVPNSRP
jgi:hypothetical protein